MKILKKGTEESATKNSSCFKAVNDLLFDAVVWAIPISSLIFMLFLFWPAITQKYDNIFGGWTTKTETKTYPVSHIRITHESDYYDDNQKNAGYALVNYRALLDKGDMIALNVIKTNALEGNSDRYSYQFQVDEINYKSTEITEGDDADDELLHLFGSPNNNKFSKIKYKKGLKEPEVTVYYKLKYQHGKLKSKELKRSATLVLPE